MLFCFCRITERLPWACFSNPILTLAYRKSLNPGKRLNHELSFPLHTEWLAQLRQGMVRQASGCGISQSGSDALARALTWTAHGRAHCRIRFVHRIKAHPADRGHRAG